jgi:CelD/BcsL family acetyltransferase involved in cellulose biosynthesis
MSAHAWSGAVATEVPEPALEIHKISSYDGLLALEPVWNRLVEEAGIDHPFLAYEWIRTWWECFGAGRELHVLLVEAGGVPLAIAPLMVCVQRFYGLKLRCLQLIANAHTQRSDFIVARSPDTVYPFLWHFLAADRDRWDVLLLPQVPAGSASIDALRTLAARDGFGTGVWAAGGSPFVRLTGTWEAYFNGLARKHRANLRNRLKRLQAIGPVALEVVRDGAEITPAIEDGLRIEAAAWKGKAGTAIGCQANLRLFYTRLAARMARRGALRLQFLTVGGRRIAFGYSILIDRKLFLLKPGYDPAYAAYSPSALLCELVLRDAFAGGVQVHDFLGADDRWKLDWTALARPHDWLFVFGRSPRARWIRFAKFRAVPWIKRARRRSGAFAARLRTGRR